jgi:hypothetical protein
VDLDVDTVEGNIDDVKAKGRCKVSRMQRGVHPL